MSKTLYSIAVYIFGFLFGFVLCFIVLDETPPDIQVIEKYSIHLIRNEVNDIVAKDKDYFVSIYYEITDSDEITNVIINKSLQLDVPINLAFSLAFVESRYDPNAINKNSHSIDKGLFQLNTRSFPDVDYFDIKQNTKYALSYLKELYSRYKSWETAIILYNAGSIRNVGNTSLNHLKKILDKERKLDKHINFMYYKYIGVKK